MASERPRRGKRILSARKAAQSDEERIRRFDEGQLRGQRILSARKAAQWDEDRIRRFKEDQWQKREYIIFVEIAEWYSDVAGPVSPKKATALREQAYRMLERDLLAGNFEVGGHSRVRFVFPGVSWTHGKMTRKWLRDAIDNDWDGRHGRSYLENCWLPRNLFERWWAWHNLPKSPPRFEPQETHPVLAAITTTRDETAAIKALAAQLRIDSKLKREEARSWCRREGFNLSWRGFQQRVWPSAREHADLEAKGPARAQAEIVAGNALKLLRPPLRFLTNSQILSAFRAFMPTEIVTLKSLRQFFCYGYFGLSNYAPLRMKSRRCAYGYYDCETPAETSCRRDPAF